MVRCRPADLMSTAATTPATVAAAAATRSEVSSSSEYFRCHPGVGAGASPFVRVTSRTRGSLDAPAERAAAEPCSPRTVDRPDRAAFALRPVSVSKPCPRECNRHAGDGLRLMIDCPVWESYRSAAQNDGQRRVCPFFTCSTLQHPLTFTF